jgi:hypothetical protein
LEKAQTRNDLTAAVPKFCLALEQHRRTVDGRVRSTQEFLTQFFPTEGGVGNDRIFKHMPNDVRGPILAAWGIRGAKAALRDDDAKVQTVVADALAAGDLDHSGFEEGLGAEVVVRWAPLAEIWSFWRGGKLTKAAIQKALVTGYELLLFDAKWFLDTLESRAGKVRGTDVLADGLNKEDLTEWIRKIHQSGDGSPKGLVTALGWDKIVAKTPNEVLIAVLDALATNIALVAAVAKGEGPKGDGPKGEAPKGGPRTDESTKMTSPPPDDSAWGDPKNSIPPPPAKALEDLATVNLKGNELPPTSPPASAAGDEDVVIVDDDMDAAEERTATGAREEPSTSPHLLAAMPVPFPEEDTAQAQKGGGGGGKPKRPEPAQPPPPRGRDSHRPR